MLREFPNEGHRPPAGLSPVHNPCRTARERQASPPLPERRSHSWQGSSVRWRKFPPYRNPLHTKPRCRPRKRSADAPVPPRILRLSGGPPGEALLIGAFLSERTKAFQSEALTLPFFPGIGYVGRLEAYFIRTAGSAAMAALIMSSRSVRILILFGFDTITRATWSDVTYSRVEPGQP